VAMVVSLRSGAGTTAERCYDQGLLVAGALENYFASDVSDRSARETTAAVALIADTVLLPGQNAGNPLRGRVSFIPMADSQCGAFPGKTILKTRRISR